MLSHTPAPAYLTEGAPPEVLLPARLARALSAHAEACRPSEACGLLLGHWAGNAGGHTRLVGYLPASNLEVRARRFRIGPADLLEARAVAATAGLDVIGVFHSHPEGPARPSTRDAAFAVLWRPWLWAVRGGNGALQVFAIGADGTRFERVSVVSSAPP